MPRNGHCDAEEVDELGVDPVGERDQHGHGQNVGAVERGRDPAGFTIGQLQRASRPGNSAGQKKAPS